MFVLLFLSIYNCYLTRVITWENGEYIRNITPSDKRHTLVFVVVIDPFDGMICILHHFLSCSKFSINSFPSANVITFLLLFPYWVYYIRIMHIQICLPNIVLRLWNRLSWLHPFIFLQNGPSSSPPSPRCRCSRRRGCGGRRRCLPSPPPSSSSSSSPGK